MYTQVVDELLDLQLEFEEKLQEAEEHGVEELERQKRQIMQEKEVEVGEINADLEKHKAAIAKLSEKIIKGQEALSKARAAGGLVSTYGSNG